MQKAEPFEALSASEGSTDVVVDESVDSVGCLVLGGHFNRGLTVTDCVVLC